jgi:hypothetical protein
MQKDGLDVYLVYNRADYTGRMLCWKKVTQIVGKEHQLVGIIVFKDYI